jgi:hypothetical protein
MDPFDINVGSVSAFSLYAVSAARKYVALVEAQISKAHADERGAAFQEYRNIANRDETDYEASIGTVDRSFEEDYRPILRFTEVIYLYMVFESYTARHVAEIQDLRHERLDVLKVLKSTNKFGLARRF